MFYFLFKELNVNCLVNLLSLILGLSVHVTEKSSVTLSMKESVRAWITISRVAVNLVPCCRNDRGSG